MAKRTPLDPGSQKRQSVIEATNKQFGENSIVSLDDVIEQDVQCISTGSLTLDLALGGKGLPRGRMIEISGPESSGKTTLALHVCAEAQKLGGHVMYIDAEHALDPVWARKVGVKTTRESFSLSQPSCGEEALQIVENFVVEDAADVIVVDSVAALVTRNELEGEMGDAHVGALARLMSNSLKKLVGKVGRSKAVVIFINQIREKVGVHYGSNETTPGGRALKFYSSCRIDVRRSGQVKDGEEVIGQTVKCKVTKNKIAPPFRVAEFDMMYDSGISYEADIIEAGLTHEVLKKSGSWIDFGAKRLANGKEKTRLFLKENPSIAAEIRDMVVALGHPATKVEVSDE